MESNIISLRRFFLIIFLSVISFFGYFFLVYQDKKTKLVFCDVGQGDATYIRVKNQIDVLIDAGPDRKVLTCLGKYMPFWDRKIELAIISHPQKDHFGGFLYLLDRYQIEKILMTPLDKSSPSFKKLKEKIIAKKISVDFPDEGTNVKILNSQIKFFWPTKEFLAQNLSFPKSQFEDDRFLHKSMVLGASSADDNNFSLVFLFEEKNFKVLFTGDATATILNEIQKQSEDTKNNSHLANLSLLKVSHHGSKNGLTKNFLELANPTVAVISVGKNNPYGHPAKEILDLLKAHQVIIRRTDDEGDITFKIPNINLISN